MQATNSGLTFAIHHSFFFHCLSSFFSVSAAPLQKKWRRRTPVPPPCQPAIARSREYALLGLGCKPQPPNGLLASHQAFGAQGRGRSFKALSNPSQAERRRTRWTVPGLTTKASAICWSVVPSSALHKIKDRFTLRADDLPRRARSNRCPRFPWTPDKSFSISIRRFQLDEALVLQRQFREGCGVMPAWRRGAWHGSVWPVRYCPAYPQATAATRLARTVPGAAFPAPPGRPAAS